MRVAEAVQLREQPLDLGIDPGIVAPRHPRRAAGDDAGEIAVGRDLEGGGQDGAHEAARRVERIERQHAPLLRIEPIEAVAAPRLRHREQAGPIGAQHEFRRDLEVPARHFSSLPEHPAGWEVRSPATRARAMLNRNDQLEGET
jgi:hypothetical protein